MAPLVLGTLALLFALLLLRWFVGADPKALIRALRYFGAALLLLGAVGLAFLDRPALAMVAGSFAWGLFTGGHAWPGGWPHGFPRGRSRPPDHSTSHVQTEWLDMELDHDSGEIDGTVRKGHHAGARLETITKADLTVILQILHDEDPQSERLLEAYMERRFGADWRSAGEHEKGPPDSGMSRAEALRVLGLEPGAGEDEIRAAHRRMMLQNHPDKGGSSYLAAKINEARDVLLGS